MLIYAFVLHQSAFPKAEELKHDKTLQSHEISPHIPKDYLIQAITNLLFLYSSSSFSGDSAECRLEFEQYRTRVSKQMLSYVHRATLSLMHQND